MGQDDIQKGCTKHTNLGLSFISNFFFNLKMYEYINVDNKHKKASIGTCDTPCIKDELYYAFGIAFLCTKDRTLSLQDVCVNFLKGKEKL